MNQPETTAVAEAREAIERQIVGMVFVDDRPKVRALVDSFAAAIRAERQAVSASQPQESPHDVSVLEARVERAWEAAFLGTGGGDIDDAWAVTDELFEARRERPTQADAAVEALQGIMDLLWRHLPKSPRGERATAINRAFNLAMATYYEYRPPRSWKPGDGVASSGQPSREPTDRSRPDAALRVAAREVTEEMVERAARVLRQEHAKSLEGFNHPVLFALKDYDAWARVALRAALDSTPEVAAP